MADFHRQISQRWKCNDDSCTNKNNFCYIDTVNRLHYAINVAQHEAWANAIAAGEATAGAPPIKLYNFVKEQQGPVGKPYRRPIQMSAAQQNKTMMEQLMEMQKFQMELQMQQQMTDSMASMQRNQELREQRREQREQREQQSAFYAPVQPQSSIASYLQAPPPSRVVHPAFQPTQSQPPRLPTPPPILYATTSSQRATPQPILQPTAPISSPISQQEEDTDVLTKFFDWKIQTTRNEMKKAKWIRARDITEEEDWNIADLKQMADGTSRIYQLAVQKGISDGLARSFRGELATYKSIYRGEQKAANALIEINCGSGGFIRE